MGARSYSARVMRFRQGVYAGHLNWGCRTLLLLMSDGMNQNCIVSIPRTELAENLNCAEARVSEWVREAKSAGFLSVVKPGRPGRTSVYQGLIKVRTADPRVRPADPLEGYAEPDTTRYAERTTEGYAQQVATEVVQTAAIGEDPDDHLGQRGQEEKTA